MIDIRGSMSKRLNFTFTGILYAIALVILAWQLGTALYLYIQNAAAVVQFPYPLEYGEGPVLDQVMRIARLENIYRSDFAVPPYSVTNTPPLYMLLQTPFAWAVGPAFWYSRIISLISVLLAALFIGLTVHRLSGSVIAALISGALLLVFPFVLYWSVLDRADTLALALSWAGLYTVVRWPDSRRGLTLAVTLFAAAVFTTQTYALVGPATALIWLLQNRQARQAAFLAGWLFAICLGLFMLLHLLTGGGFLLNVITASVNRGSHIGFMANLTGLLIHAWILVLGAAGFLVVERWWYPTRTWPLVLPYALLATVSMLMFRTTGSSASPLYEPAAALCLAAGAVLAWPPPRSYLLKTIAVVLLAVQVNGLANWSRNDYLPLVQNKVQDEAEIAQLAQIVREAPGPVLIDEYMGLAPLAGRPIYIQPYEFSQLQLAGLWSPDALINAIQQREFPVILLYEPGTSPPKIVTRWTPEIRSTIWENYHSVDTIGGVWIYVPNE